MTRKLVTVSSCAAGDVLDPDCPVLADISRVNVPHRIEAHSHRRGQFVYAGSGSLEIRASGPAIMLPPGFAAWIPCGVAHAVTASRAIDYCSLFIDQSVCNIMAPRPQLLHLTTLLRELTRSAAEDDHSSITGARQRMHAVILDQLQLLEPAHIALPMPAAERLHSLVRHFLSNPDDCYDARYWADVLAMSERSLLRLFRKETGMTPVQWLHQLRVLRAIEMMEAGKSVKTVSLELGYNQASAFISMFKKITGRTPCSYARTFMTH